MSSSNNKNTSNNSAEAATASDFDLVKEYLLQCPHVPSDSPAIKCALEAMEKEQQRRIRDAKLQRKFGATATRIAAATNTNANTSLNTSGTLSDGDVVVVDSIIDGENPPTPSAKKHSEEDDIMMDEEWQDVPQKNAESPSSDKNIGGHNHAHGGDSSDSYLGKELAKISIDSIAEHHVLVASPLAAIAVALHAALRSPLLGFACTGVPQDETSRGGGFAPPVRELPATQFLPLNWENDNNIAFRYRKNGTGAVVLRVVNATGGGNDAQADATIQVTLVPANSIEAIPSQSLTFPLSEHLNLDSWNAALQKQQTKKIAPSLHYKHLSGMMSKFCQTFDLGDAAGSSVGVDAPYVDNTVVYGKNGATTSTSTTYPSSTKPRMSAGAAPDIDWKDGRVPATLNQAFPDARRLVPPGGDFADDLLPAGLQDPRFAHGPGGGGRMGGNLMGPNHPMFSGGGMGDLGGPSSGGPGTMQPRFDPVYPPGVDDDKNNPKGDGSQKRRQKPSRTGEPNPDHLPPPNSLGGGDNMFL